MHYLLVLVANLSIITQGYAHSLTQRINQLIEKELPNATASILIKNAKNGYIYYKKNPDKLLSPASTIKLFTATAAFYQWKPDHHFDTTLLADKKNLYIRFGGSPSLTTAQLSALLVNYCATNQLKELEGSIILDNSLFKPPYYPNGTSYDDLGWYFAAPDAAVIVDGNSVAYQMKTNAIGERVTLTPEINAPNKLTLINQVITVRADEEKNHCSLNIEVKAHNTLRLYGCAAQTKQPKRLQLALSDPAFLAQHVIKEALKKHGIVLKGIVTSGKTPAEAKVLSTIPSKPLYQLVDHMLKESDNLYADNLAKHLAYSLTGEASNKQAAYALKTILTEHLPLNMQQLELADGVGTRYNLATAEQIAILLTHIYRNKPLYSLILNALPQSGVSGTLKDRMKKPPLEKIIFAKTGSMHDSSSLSGYLINPNGTPIIFSIIFNGINKPIQQVKSLEEQILVLVNEEVNADMDSSAYV